MMAPNTEGPEKVESWRMALLPATATLQEAILNLNRSASQIALVVDGSDRLIGTVTDGDIRRAMLQGLQLSSSLAAIVHKEALVVPPQMGREMVLQLMRANRIHQLPVVDDEQRVVGLHLWSTLITPVERPNLMVIMAGGAGTRMRPYTESCPKPMLPVAGRPMLEHIIVRAQLDGFTRFVIAIHYLGQMIEDHFGSGARWGVDISYVREKEPLGTAGALALLEASPDRPFVVSNGDILTDIRYSELLDFHVRHGAAATMAVRLHEWQHPFGVVQTDGVDIVGFVEKPIAQTHVNAGMYVLEPSAIDALVPGESCHMPALFERLKDQGQRTIVYPMHEPWLDMGRPDDYDQANGSDSLPRAAG